MCPCGRRCTSGFMRTDINGLPEIDYGPPLGGGFFIYGQPVFGLLFKAEDALGVVFERDLKLVEEGVFKPAFGQACIFDEERDRNLAERVIVQVDLRGIRAVDFVLRRDHSGSS